MNIYLFELDSVRNSKKEAEIGQAALFREIFLNGNSVILTYNQLSDSAAFWAGLQEERTYNAIMELCRMGRIKVSLYGSMRTAAQYILIHIADCIRKLEARKKGESGGNQDFYFSLIPMDDEDVDMLKNLRDAIMFSDVQLLREKSKEAGKNAAKYLFLYRYAQLILTLSRSETANHKEKQAESKTLMYYWDRAMELPEFGDGGGIFAQAAELMRGITERETRTDLQRRSVWYGMLEEEPGIGADGAEGNSIGATGAAGNGIGAAGATGNSIGAAEVAEAVIDLCYNYALEDSISAADKRYTDGDGEDFRIHFMKDLRFYLDSAGRGEHIFHGRDEARKNSQKDFASDVLLPDWQTALNLVKRNLAFSSSGVKSGAETKPGAETREERLKIQQKRWHRVTRRSLLKYLLLAAGYAAAFLMANELINCLQDLVTDPLEEGVGIWGKIGWDLLSVAVFGIFSSIIFEKLGLPDILETVQGVIGGIREQIIFLRFRKAAK